MVDPRQRDTEPRSIWQLPAVKALFLVLAWLVVWQFGRLLEFSEHASIWFPAAGLTYAALLLSGSKAIIPLTVSATLITYWFGHDFNPKASHGQLVVAGLLFSAAHIGPYYVGTRLIRWLAYSGKVSVPQLIVTFLVSSAAITLATAILVLNVLIYTDLMPAEDFATSWLPFWIGDLAGVIVMAPLFCSLIAKFYDHTKFDLSTYVTPEQLVISRVLILKMILTSLLLTFCMLLNDYANNLNSAFAIFFLVIPHMWIASTESPFYNALSLALSSCLIAFWVSVLGLMEYAMVYQFAINVIATNALFGIAVPTLAADNRKLRQKVRLDSLTQTASKEHLTKRAKFEVLRSKKDDSYLSIIVFDVDNFKHINDTFGHAKGDDALRVISQTAKLLLRPTDLLGRFGGDEFVAILPNTRLDSAHQIASRILHEINRVSVDGHGLASSFGIAQLQPGEDFEELFSRADKALYEAKSKGRNCIVGMAVGE